MNKYLDIAPEVQAALAAGKPVVALESTIISHGMPYPKNVETALLVEETIRRNFRFYEARTVHESSLSPCVHAILAAKIGDAAKAYELYLRTARLDLDDYNREVEEGCHVTSMAGSWLAVVEGFGGMRMADGVLNFTPHLPEAWRSLAFRVDYRGRILTVTVTHDGVEVRNEGEPVEIAIGGERRRLPDDRR